MNDSKNFQLEDISYKMPFGGDWKFATCKGKIDIFRFWFENGYWNLYTKVTPDGKESVERTTTGITCTSYKKKIIYKGTYYNGEPLKIKQWAKKALHFNNFDFSQAGLIMPRYAPRHYNIRIIVRDLDTNQGGAALTPNKLHEAVDYSIIPFHSDELSDHTVQLRLESEFGYAVLKNPKPDTLQMVMNAFSYNQPVYFSIKDSLYHPEIQLVKIGEGRM